MEKKNRHILNPSKMPGKIYKVRVCRRSEIMVCFLVMDYRNDTSAPNIQNKSGGISRCLQGESFVIKQKWNNSFSVFRVAKIFFYCVGKTISGEFFWLVEHCFISAWQKSDIENASKLIRQYIPKGTGVKVDYRRISSSRCSTKSTEDTEKTGFKTPIDVIFNLII